MVWSRVFASRLRSRPLENGWTRMLWDCAKFGGNRCSNFDSMQILIFCTLSLKMPIHAPKIGVFGAFAPKMGSSINETPKRHILGRKHVVWRMDRVGLEISRLLFCRVPIYRQPKPKTDFGLSKTENPISTKVSGFAICSWGNSYVILYINRVHWIIGINLTND